LSIESTTNAICDRYPACNPPFGIASVPELPSSIKDRNAASRKRWEPVFAQLKPIDWGDTVNGMIPTDLHDLITGHHALRAFPVMGWLYGLQDQVVIWYPDQAVCVPLDEFERDYRVLDRELVQLAKGGM
jgi:hypothetical protein